MRLRLVVLAVVLVVVAAGCTTSDGSFTVARAAPPQEAFLDWIEPTAAKSPRLVFIVRGITVTRDGWRARIGIRNESGVPWTIGDTAGPRPQFGVMLFVTGEMEELEQRNRDGQLPGVREARTVSPTPPARLDPGATWEGTIGAPGALAAGRWLRVVFGPLVAEGDAPDGLPSPLLWISDNAHQLRG